MSERRVSSALKSRVGRVLRQYGLLHEHPAGIGRVEHQDVMAALSALGEHQAGVGRVEHQDVMAALSALGEQVRALQPPPPPDAGELYCPTAPSPQNALDIFAGEWASEFPALLGVTSGWSPLFTSEMITWGVDLLGGVQGQRVLELGPLEGAHSYMLDRLGAAEVVAVEANTRAYLKCLVTKELLNITSARFLCGDALRYLESELARGASTFDLCVASGILYHLLDPVAALDLFGRASDRLLLWTMYYDEDKISAQPEVAAKFVSTRQARYHGFDHVLHQQDYQQATSFKGFCGGSAAGSAWLTRADILAALDHFGFDVVGIAFEGETSNGPCFAVAARRR